MIKRFHAVLAAAIVGMCQPALAQTAVLKPSKENCLRYIDVQLNLTSRLDGVARKRLLTPEALASGVEIYTTNAEFNAQGNVSLLYWQPAGECVLWYETISVVEYATRMGLVPYGLSPYYKKD